MDEQPKKRGRVKRISEVAPAAEVMPDEPLPLKTFAVSHRDCKTMQFEAATEAEAIAKYKLAAGIIDTPWPFKVTEVG